MKTLLLLLMIIGCGKNVNKFKNDFHYSSLLNDESETLPHALTFKAINHQVNFNVSKNINNDFFETSKDLNRYYSHELSHIHPDSIYHLETMIPEDIDLYLHDNGKEYFIDQKNLKLHDDLLDRLSQKKSYLYLVFNNNSPRREATIIKNFHTYDVTIVNGDTKDYLAEAIPLNLSQLIEQAGDNQMKWWIKKDSLNHYKIAYSSSNDLKEIFNQYFYYQKRTLKRINGKGSSFTLPQASFIKITGSQVMQKQTLHHFSKTYYTQIGELPYSCTFTEAKAQHENTLQLSSKEIREILKIRIPQVDAWNYVDALQLNLVGLSSGHFDVGIIDRKCISSMGPAIKKKKVNQEKELELVIESYIRRE